jgi:hypothetical protein
MSKDDDYDEEGGGRIINSKIINYNFNKNRIHLNKNKIFQLRKKKIYNYNNK